ncbi:selenium metabolism-associated LysR family transcriptional regulator [Radiobacillus deserti]|uniref:LysR family transcriptional regulator n=1 Tax=Radiobacillus deserti TaxID=2594883 RepID=A0A516KCQ5_9BACI|nr:selenium metabolism-associated LysR family transcriptional regulator [Radiobacillus deserti]QDP39184.1 LysR family transcriptional regulator [Radiobacillus deserti]
MNIQVLKTFLLVVETGSINQAAKSLYLSQPAITKQIRQLEEEYGALLFDRSDGRLTLTDSGNILYPFAKTMVQDYNLSKEAVAANLEGYEETLNIGASLTIGEYLLPRLLGTFKKQYPDYHLSLVVENTPQILTHLTDDKIDLALVEGLVETSHLSVERLKEDELVLIHSPEHSWSTRENIALEELTHERMIWREPSSGTRAIIENFLTEWGILEKIESYMELGSTQSIKSAVEAGLGVSIVSKLTVAREIEQGIIREVKIRDIELKRNLWIVWATKRFTKKSVRAFMEFIRNQYS